MVAVVSEGQAIVVDNGSGHFKAGIAGEEGPREVFPSITGRPRWPRIKTDPDQTDFYMGSEALERSDILELKYPIEHGIVTNWDDMEKIWHDLFYTKLKINPKEHPFILTQVPQNPRPDREKLVQIMFETFNVPRLFVSIPAYLSLYASGRTTGLVIDSGDGVTCTAPIDVGSLQRGYVIKMNLGGRDLTAYLNYMLSEHRYSNFDVKARKIVQEIKERHCYVATDFSEEISHRTTAPPVHYEFPDGHSATLDKELFIGMEQLFQPSLITESSRGLHQITYDSLMMCNLALRREMASNIVLSGGTTLLPGFSERITRELTAMMTKSVRINVVAPPERINSAWIGGSIISSMTTLRYIWLTKAEYEEAGPAIIGHKFF